MKTDIHHYQVYCKRTGTKHVRFCDYIGEIIADRYRRPLKRRGKYAMFNADWWRK